MTSAQEYALLAAGSYDDVRKREYNRSPVPSGWTELRQYATNGSGSNAALFGDGFSARVYKNSASGEIVVSYAGTEFDLQSAGLLADFRDGNIPLAVGNASEQATAAARLYQRVKAEQGSNITFTGHSLGGGLASAMAVWFDRPARVFAPAPFEFAATRTDGLFVGNVPLLNASAVAVTRRLLESDPGDIDAAFAQYVPSRDFASRENNVQAWAVAGEVLESTLFSLSWIESSGRTRLFNAGVTELGALPKHSIDLHVAGLLSTGFNDWASKLPTALPRIFDSTLYGADPIGNQPDFLVKLVRNEVGATGVAANGMLTHFANDLGKLGTNIAGLNKAAQDALIAQGIEWYFWQGTDYAGQEFFVNNAAQPGLLQYTTAQGAGLAGAQNKAVSYVNAWLTPIANSHNAFGGYVNFDQWNVAAGSAGVTAIARDAAKSQIFVGGAGADTLTGGNKGDTFFAGAGDDILNGGGGDNAADLLYGGAGTDLYKFTGTWGRDTIEDSDGLGTLQVEGFAAGLPQGKKIGAGKYQSTDSKVTYTLVKITDTRTDLAIAFTGRTDTLTIRNWSPGQFGIPAFDETPVPASSVVIGDTKADVNDALSGTSGADQILGLTGNDALSGGDGNDLIEGGLGSDVLAGGRGADVLNGGEGRDFIFGSATASTGWSDTRPDWMAITGNAWSIPGVSRPVADDEGNIIDAGAGDDWVGAGTGNDVVRAGSGSDLVYAMGGDDYVDGGDDADELHGDASILNTSGSYIYSPPERHGNDTLVGGGGNDTMYGEGGADELYGGADNDVMYGDADKVSVPVEFHGNDTLDGGDGDDQLWGDGGNDELFGGTGNDTLQGDARADDLPGSAHGADYLDGEEGNDVLFGEGGADTLYGGIGDDMLVGDTAESDPAYQLAAQFHGNDYLDGEEGNDTLWGSGGDDVLIGGAGNDWLAGENETTTTAVSALTGNDTVDGGNDELFGGSGNDISRRPAANDRRFAEAA